MSLTVARYVTKAMERIAPLSLAEKWDNVGLLLESPVPPPQSNAHKILLTIDLTTQVANEALALPASCIIAYHPILFKPLSSITLANPLQASLLRCAAAGISVYCPHTSLDSVHGGINDWLASGLGKGDVQLIGEDREGKGGAGRIVRLHEGITLAQLQERIKAHLGLQHLQVAMSPEYPRQVVQSVAICAGSGGSMLLGIDADVYFTGEMSHHEVLAAVAAGKNVVLCGHTNTERGYLPVLASKLNAEFAKADGEELRIAQQATVHVSTQDRHPLAVV
ncbi:NGG1p interacting factor 3 [Amylostereum chailletii]|nr:NGG1p interacting factor 3 [Amylostereum chailletii]